MAALKRLEFYMDRYMEHKKSLDLSKEKIADHLLKFNPKQTNSMPLLLLNTEIVPGCLDFYLEALQYSALCRSFVVFTYPFSYKIVNKQKELLFAENQYCLEYTLEIFDDYIKAHPVELLVTTTEGTPCMVKEFADVKSKIIDLKLRMTEQFENAQKEFMDPQFV